MTSRAWDTVLSHLKTEVSDQVFETWLRPLRFVSREGSLLLVATPHKFFKQWIEENYMPQIEQAARKELGGNVIVPPTPAGQMGTFAVLQDPQGAVFNVIKYSGPADPPPGY